MGKGSGGTGRGGGPMSPRAVQSLLSRAGGVISAVRATNARRFENLTPGRLGVIEQAFEGRDATAVATGKRPANGGTVLPPIKLYVQRNRDGRTEVKIEDGRNRSVGAKAAGATHIRAVVVRETQNARGGWKQAKPVEMIVKL